MNLKNQLRFYLDSKGLTASQLARKAGVPKQSISGWLAGSNPRDIKQIKKVADVLSVSVDNLVFGTGVEKNKNGFGLASDTGEWVSGMYELKYRRVMREKL